MFVQYSAELREKFCIWILGIFFIASVQGALEPIGAKCGQKRCKNTEYCSPFDSHCQPCSGICDSATHNYQPELCAQDCQEYLHDLKYVLRVDLGRDIGWRDNGQLAQIKVAVALSIISLIGVIFLYAWTFLRNKKIRGAWVKTCGTKWSEKKISRNKVRDDVEAAHPKQQNGLKLKMPTISGSLSGANQGSIGTAASNTSTPNTTSTPLSKRHPSEDTTLDYAYDNPAMTPSPEAAAPKTERESSI